MAIRPMNWLLGLLSLDISIDLGTSNTLVNLRGKGIIINEPSWMAIEKKTKCLLAIGAEAKEMAGRAPPNVVVIRPLRDGVISDFDITQAMLEYFFGKAHEKSIVPNPRSRVVVGIPAGATEVERRAVYNATMAAGAREAYLIEEPTAAALGGVISCTRPISHEYHWLTEDQMVGLSGREVSPRLYLGVGVSGQIQHAVGIMGARMVIAINSDQNAPIFKIADYGIVGDLYQVVPKLIDQIQGRFGH